MDQGRSYSPNLNPSNLPTADVDYHVPFGGPKGSSYGPRKQGKYAKEFFTVMKTAYTLG